MATNAERQAAWRKRRDEELRKLRVAAAAPPPPAPASKATGTTTRLGLLTLTEDEVNWLIPLVIARRTEPERLAAQVKADEDKERKLQAGRQAKWGKATRTAPLFDVRGLVRVPVENVVLTATDARVTGLYRGHDGRLCTFVLRYMGHREAGSNGWWRVEGGSSRPQVDGQRMGAMGYRSEAATTRRPWAHMDPLVGKDKAELRRVVSANHPDKGNPHADPVLYQQAVEAMDRLGRWGIA